MEKANYKDFLGKKVHIVMDRPMGVKHPKWNFIYPLNYGYVPNTISGDGAKLDAYIIGVFEPLEEYEGKCIAAIHRLDDDDDKLIIAPEGKIYTREQIEALVEFQERFFKHIIIEKPLSTNIHLANELIKNYKGEKVVTVISQHRFDYPVNFVKKSIESGDLGKITLVNAKLKCYRPNEYYTDSYWRGTLEKEGGSTVINQAYHIIDTLVFLLGEPKEVKTFLGNYKYNKKIETEDTAVSIFKYKDKLCTFSATNTSILDWKTSFEIIGTKGEIAFTIDFPEEILEFNVDDKIKQKYDKEIKQVNMNFDNNKDLAVNYYGLSHNKQFEDFKNAILNHTDIKVGLEQAIKTQNLLEMIYKVRGEND